MRTVFTVAGISLLKLRKEKFFILIMICMALFFTTVFGLVFGNAQKEVKVPVAIADLDGSPLSVAMAQSLEETGAYGVRFMSEDEVYNAVRQGQVDAGFIIPQGFEASLATDSVLKVTSVSLAASNTSMVIGKTLERKVTERLLAAAVEDVAADLNETVAPGAPVDAKALSEKVTGDFASTPALAASFEHVAKEGEGPARSPESSSFGVYLMFTMFTVVFTAGDILQERRDGTWMRLMAAPVSRAGILAGKVLGTYVIGAGQLTVLLVAGKLLHKVNYGPNPLGIAVVLGVFLLAVTGLGIMLSTFVRTLPQLGALAPIVIVSTCMLGGCYWPLEIVSPLMQTVAKFTPQAWAMTAMTDLASRGVSLAATSTNILVLLGFAALFFTVGVSRVKFE